jgi:phospholipid N-methyltransferase
VIVSALPFSNFALADVQAIFDRYLQHTGPGGVITWFGYRASRAARALTAEPSETARHHAVHAHLAGYGGSTTTVWANVPPARVTRLRPHG